MERKPPQHLLLPARRSSSPPRPGPRPRPRPACPSSRPWPGSSPSSPGTWRAPRPRRAPAGPAEEAQPGRARGRARPRTRRRPSPGWPGPPARSARSKTPPSSATSSTPWPSASTANPPAPNTSPAVAGSCTDASATPSARNGSPQTRSAKATCPKAGHPRQAPDDTLDPRAVGSPALVASMLRAPVATIGRRQGPALPRLLRLHVLRADAPLRSRRAHQRRLPPARDRLGPPDLRRLQPRRREGAYTDDGQVHEHRGLKGRTKGRPSPRSRRPVRKVPIPPELVQLLRAHIQTFGVAPDGRLFRSENGNPLQPSTWWQVWQKVRAASLTPEPARLAPDEAPLRPPPLRGHLAAQLQAYPPLRWPPGRATPSRS